MIHLRILLQELNEKNQDALSKYFNAVGEHQFFDLLFYAVNPKYFQLLSRNKLKTWVLEKSAIPLWLYEKSLNQTKNASETMSLILPKVHKNRDVNFSSILNHLLELKNERDSVVLSYIHDLWENASHAVRLLFNRIISGQGIPELSETIFYPFLFEKYKLSPSYVALRFSSLSNVHLHDFKAHLLKQMVRQEEILPHNFPLIEIIGKEDIERIQLSDWNIHIGHSQLEVQLIKTENKLYVWGRDALFLNPHLPEPTPWLDCIPNDSHVFADLLLYEAEVLYNKEKTIEILTKKGLKKQHNLKLEIDSIFKWHGKTNRPINTIEISSMDREYPIEFKRSLKPQNIDELIWAYQAANNEGANGILFRHKKLNQSIRWPRPKISFVGTLFYAQRGEGALANQFVQYTFAVLHKKEWISVAKTEASCLTAENQKELEKWILDNKVERFGPVLSVPPKRFFELSAERVTASSRHKSGVRLIGVRPLRELQEADIAYVTKLSFLLSQLPKS